MERLGDGVQKELGRLGHVGEIGAVVAAWPSAVGDEVARNAWPARLSRDGTLVVHTGSSAWAFELTQLEQVVRDRLAAALPGSAIGRLRFAPGSLPEPPSPAAESHRAAPAQPSPEARSEAERVTALIDDDELREAVARAAALSLERARADRVF